MATEALDSQRAQFLALAGTVFEQLFGTDGQNGLVTFAEREERACALTDELARWLMAEHVAQDPAGNTIVRSVRGRSRRSPVGRTRRRFGS